MYSEILIKISEYVTDWSLSSIDFSGFSTGAKEVKTLRLTCQRMCKASSHLLIHHVSVNLNSKSLARLENISEQSSISKGIQAVRVVLNYYDPVLAHDLRKFVLFHMNRLQEETNWMEDEQNLNEIPKEDVLAKIKIYTRMLTAWATWLQNDPSDDDMLYLDPMIKCQAQYKELFNEQMELLSSGSFEKRAAAAFLKMPIASRLELQDVRYWTTSRPIAWYSELNLDGTLDFGYMMEPIAWHDARVNNLGSPPVDLLVSLPIAIHTAGSELLDLHIEVSHPGDFSALAVRGQKCQQFGNTVHRLKKFSFGSNNPGFWDSIPSQELEHLGTFFSTVLNTKYLQQVHLDLNFLWDKDMAPPLFSLGSLIEL